MPTNEQRRQAAKRKLERQLERRAERARKRRTMTVALSGVGAVLLIGVVVAIVLATRGGSGASGTAAGATSETPAPSTDAAAPSTAAPQPLPAARAEALPATVTCAYPATKDQPAAKANTAPSATDVTTDGTVAVTLDTSAGAIPLTLDRAASPCTVNSFLSLAKQGYFDDTPCHRLTTAGIKVLQCGDPTGKGTGGPGYSFANEFPTDTYPQGDAALQAPATYPRGTIAMANAGAGTNGSQFFLVYDDSPLPPQYTVFGTIGEAGLKVLDAIAAKGTADGSGDGAPATPVTVTSVTGVA